MNENLSVFNFKTENNSIIKVIGVGGGGGNAVNHMYNEGIHDVTFVVCNTDKKALSDSPVPQKLQLGEGLGAGNRPERARKATEESIEQVKDMLNDGTKMVFITAGMGGGTGTGAAPIIAKTAKEMGLLTVGIVTIPFRWEGIKKINQALDGVDEISRNVDALLVINNERLRRIYNDLSLDNAFAKADDTLCNAARSISEIITMHGKINLDFQDVTTVLKDGGVAIMSTGYGSGDGRVKAAIDDALHSPLLNDNDIYNSKKVLLHIIHSGDEGEGAVPLMMDEMNEINDFMELMEDKEVETKWGYSKDPALKDRVRVTILATGFGVKDVNTKEMDDRIAKRDEQTRKEEEEAAIKQAENNARISQYYRDSDDGYIHKPIYSFIFENDELDNDDIISAVELKPTFKRKKTDPETFRVNNETEAAPAVGSTIVF